MSIHLIRSLIDSRKGTSAVIFSLVLFPMMSMVGSAFDYSRASKLNARLQAAIDASVLDLCQAPATASAGDLKIRGQKTVAAFMPGTGVTVDTPVVTNDPRRISLVGRITYDTAFMRIVNINTIPIAAQSGCEASERFFEVALALDTTGSMATSDGTMTKIEALKKASKNFVAYMFDTASLADRTRISLVPFSAAVAVDPATYRNATWIDQEGRSTLHWQNVDKTSANAAGFTNRLQIFDKLKNTYSSWGWAGCLETLPYPANVKDGKPSASIPDVPNDTLYVPMFAPDESGDGGATDRWEQLPNYTWVYRSSANSYLEDSTSDSECQTSQLPANDPSREQTRISRGCKYKKPTDATSSSGRGPNYMCSSRPLTKLSTSKSTLTTEIDKFVASGNTNIHEGVMWGWRTLSPNSVLSDTTTPVPVPYDRNDTTKVLVVMTDGENTWGTSSYLTNYSVLKSTYSSMGYFTNADGSNPNGRLPAANANPTNGAQARAGMDALTREACSNARAAGVIVYTIGFSITQDPIDAQGLQLLKDCAGQADRAFVANNADSLINIFKGIAQGINQLRISR